MNRITITCLATVVSATLFGCAAAARNRGPTHYHVAREIPVPGDVGWDYLAFDRGSARLFVTHGTRVQVIDGGSFALLGEVGDMHGVRGVALAPDLGRGYISTARTGAIVVFDLRTLERVQEIQATGQGPDAILYDPFTHRVFSFNGGGRNATAVEAATGAVAGTIPLDAKPEFAVSDGAGHVYVNLEDRNSLAVIDPRNLTVQHTWAIAGCEEPTGLAIDRAHHRLFSVCHNNTMAVIDSSSGRVIATLPIGARVDGAAFDASAGLAFASAGDGTLTVVREETPDKFTVVQTVKTKPDARTLALDESTHRIFSVTAKLGSTPPATAEQPHPRPAIEPGSFELLVVEP